AVKPDCPTLAAQTAAIVSGVRMGYTEEQIEAEVESQGDIPQPRPAASLGPRRQLRPAPDGSAAPVTLVQFVDYTAVHAGLVDAWAGMLAQTFPKEVRLVVRQLPGEAADSRL